MYLLLASLLLVAVAGAVIIGFAFLKSLFMTAVTVNSIIVVVFMASLFAAYRYIFLVNREFTIFADFAHWCEKPEERDFNPEALDRSILGSSLGAVSCSVRDHGVLVLNSSSDGRSIVKGFEDNFGSRIQLVSYLSGFLVLLGLLGTFLGLTITLQSMGEILATLAGGLSDASDTSILKVMIELIVKLKEPMSGMGTAFSTSLFGLSASAVVGLLGLLLRRMYDQLKNRLEKWLNERTELLSKLASETLSEFPMGQDMSAQMLALSRQMAKDNQMLLEALDTSNKYLLKLILLQQQSVEAIAIVRDQSTEITREIGLGNELAGRLIKESRQIVTTIEQSEKIRNHDN
jgi:hypothetical protein